MPTELPPGAAKPRPTASRRAAGGETMVPASPTTHCPNPNGGTICGKPAMSNPASYNAEDPTCPPCADWVAKTRAHTARIHGPNGILAQRAAAAAAAASESGEE